MSKQPLLEIKDLVTTFSTDFGVIRAVDGVSFHVNKGETLGVVGESGCGKSVTALSIMRLLPQPMGKIESGEVLFNGRDISTIPLNEMRKVRGNDISMIFQEPMTALNPVHTVGRQLTEILHLHENLTAEEARGRAVELLKKVGIPSPEIRLKEYPHQLSGGMRQRVVIAIALACNPQLVIADEPTTALDVTIQAQILNLMQELQENMGMAIIFITHDLGVIAELCDRVVVMYAGRIAETGTVEQIFNNPVHPYTKGLLESIPTLETKRKSLLKTIKGMVPALHEMPSGCRFQNRCPYAVEECGRDQPPLEEIESGHYAACIRWKEVKA